MRDEGLTEEDAAERLREFGPNKLPAKKPPSPVEVFLRQFLSPLIYVLLAAGVVALLLEDLLDSVFIFIVLLVNAIIGMAQELRAEKSATELQRLLKTMARARRAGREEIIDAENLVPGDIVLLESGNRVPADLKLLSATNLSIDESLLTGESIPRDKLVGVLDEEVRVSDRSNMAFAGSIVVTGRAVGAVVGTGSQTELGAIANAVTLIEDGKPPLLIRLEKFAKQISYIVLLGSALLAVVAVARGIPLTDVFFMAIALSVSAIPEGLPVAVTVALAYRVGKMSKKNVLTRRLAAVESLGSCTCIASDKTGTLTVNKQTVKLISLAPGDHYLVTGEGYSGDGRVTKEPDGAIDTSGMERLVELAEVGALCNEASLVKKEGYWKHSGDAVDVAILAFALKVGLDIHEVRTRVGPLGDIPFESERRYAAKFYSADGLPKAAVKGAVESMLPLCTKMRTKEGIVPLDSAAIETEAVRLADGGYRVLAVAIGEMEGVPPDTPAEEDIPPLTLLGLIGLIDPARPEVRGAVERCKCAGIKVIMITGDHPATALAIARDLGIASSNAVLTTGTELEEMGNADVPEFLDRIRTAKVFARVTPLQKLEIVDALIKEGNFVAVTGDGVNDAPALRKASIGVAMGSGTDVAKDASSIIITDDNFASIVSGVEEGRYAYENIRKVTFLLISTGAAEIILFVMAILFGVTDAEGVPILPLLAVQLLWLNVVTNGIQHIALALEGGDPNVMMIKPRGPEEGIFNRVMIQQVAVASLTMGLMAFFVYYGLYTYAGYSAFQTMNLTFLFMVLLENMHAFNCRSEVDSAFKVPISRNYFIVLGVLAAQGVHILAMNIPIMQQVLRIGPVTLTEWLFLLGLSILLILVVEVLKFFRRRGRGPLTCATEEQETSPPD